MVEETQVVIVGAGPVGLTLAIDLGQRGVKCLLLERNATTAPYPKMDRSNARTMEIFRRIGCAEEVRAVGYPPDASMDVFVVTRLCDPPLARLVYPSVAERRAEIAACRDGSQPVEAYQLVSQNALEPALKRVAERTPNVTVRYGCEVTGFIQDHDGVSVRTRSLDGELGEAQRKAIADSASVSQRRMHEMRGAEFGYSYAGSPLVATEADDPRARDTCTYEPSARPGVRLPHMWLADGRAIQDALGRNYTLLVLQAGADTSPLPRAFAALGAPFEVFRSDELELRRVYEATLVLLRPDLHVVWRGCALPCDAEALATMATGHGPAQLPATCS